MKKKSRLPKNKVRKRTKTDPGILKENSAKQLWNLCLDLMGFAVRLNGGPVKFSRTERAFLSQVLKARDQLHQFNKKSIRDINAITMADFLSSIYMMDGTNAMSPSARKESIDLWIDSAQKFFGPLTAGQKKVFHKTSNPVLDSLSNLDDPSAKALNGARTNAYNRLKFCYSESSKSKLLAIKKSSLDGLPKDFFQTYKNEDPATVRTAELEKRVVHFFRFAFETALSFHSQFPNIQENFRAELQSRFLNAAKKAVETESSPTENLADREEVSLQE